MNLPSVTGVFDAIAGKKSQSNESTSAGFNLEQELEALLKYGKPDLSYVTKGWHCRIDMWVPSKGAEFKVSSDFEHQTARAALLVCKERLADTLRKYGVQV